MLDFYFQRDLNDPRGVRTSTSAGGAEAGYGCEVYSCLRTEVGLQLSETLHSSW